MNLSKLPVNIQTLLFAALLLNLTTSAQPVTKVEYNGLIFNLFTYTKDPSVKLMAGGDYKEAMIGEVSGMTVAENGDIYFTEPNTHNIRKLTRTVGTAYGRNYAGNENGFWNKASFTSPQSITNDGAGFLYVVDGGEKNNRIRMINPAGTVTTYCAASINTIGKSAPKQFNYILADKKGNIYATYKNEHAIYLIKPDKSFSTLAGSGTKGNKDGAAQQAAFSNPDGICITKSGEIYVADYGNNAIRKIESNGTVSTVLKGIKAPRRLVEDANGELLISCAEGLVLLKADKSKKLLADKANRALAGMHPNLAKAPLEFDEVKDVCLTISKGILFFDKNCIRIARMNHPLPAATVAMPPLNAEKERLRLVRTVIDERRNDVKAGDSVFIVFDYNELGFLYSVTEFIRLGQDRQYLTGERINILYDSLYRPNMILYPLDRTSAGSSLPHLTGALYYNYDEKGKVFKSGSVLMLEVDSNGSAGYQLREYDEKGGLKKINRMSLRNKLTGYDAIKRDAKGAVTEMYNLRDNGQPYKTFTSTVVYDDKKSYAAGFGAGLASLDGYALINRLPLSYPNNLIKSSFSSVTGTNTETSYEYVYNASGYPTNLTYSVQKPDRKTFSFKLYYHTPETDKNYTDYFSNAKKGAKLLPDSIKNVRPPTPEMLFDFDTTKGASYFLGEWVPADYIKSITPFQEIEFQPTDDRRIYVHGTQFTESRKLQGIYINPDDIKNGYLRTVHSMFGNRDNEATRGKYEIELQFFVLKQNVLKVLVRFLHGNRTDQNTEYWIYLTRKDTAFF